MTSGAVWTSQAVAFKKIYPWNGKIYGVSATEEGKLYSHTGDLGVAPVLIGMVGDSYRVTNRLADFNHRLYIGKVDGLYAYDGVQITVVNDNQHDEDPNNYQFMDSFNGSLYFSFKNQLQSFNGATIEVIRDFSIYETITNIQSAAGRLWVATKVNATPPGTDLEPGTYCLYYYDREGFYLYDASKSGAASIFGLYYLSNATYKHLIPATAGLVGSVTTNYCHNPAFIDYTGWEGKNPDGPSGLLRQDTGGAIRGGTLQVTNNGTTLANYYALYTGPSDKPANTQYTVSFYLNMTRRCLIQVKNNGNVIGSLDIGDDDAAWTGLQRYSITVTTGGVANKDISLTFHPYCNLAGEWSTAIISNVQIELGATASAYFDGSITDTPSMTYDWTGAVGKSTSTATATTTNTAWVYDIMDEYINASNPGALTSSFFDCGFPNIDKALNAVTPIYEGLILGDTIDVYVRTYNGRAWSAWEDLGQITASSASSELKLPLASPNAVFKKLQLRVVLTRVIQSRAALRGFSFEYMLSPDYKREWQVSMLCVGKTDNPLELLDGTSETKTAHELRQNLYACRASDVPVGFEDIDFSYLDGAIDDAVTTLTLASTDLFPDAGFVKIDDEIIQYEAKTATTLTGCTRGVLGTAAAAHDDEAICNIYYRVVLSEIVSEEVYFSPDALQPATPTLEANPETIITAILKES
jgi:hypothetical protein